MTRVAFALAHELRPHGVASVALSPGWMRTELVRASEHTDEAQWRDNPRLAQTESPRDVGRAIAALTADSNVMRHSAACSAPVSWRSEYGFTDVYGRVVQPFSPPG
jgi:NAD(P)-dependent dehydrogenase (short-subunit alcohol dehydrogenase family)